MDRKCTCSDLVGQYIDDGRLLLIQTIGSGSNGVVYLALDLATENPPPRQYAVKCVPKAPRGSRALYMQRQEVEFQATVCDHPNILTLHTVIEDEHNLFIVSDHCPGGDFFTFLSNNRPFRRNDAYLKRIFLQLLDAVEACHDENIFHRDIKPENILISADAKQVYLCDFGLATTKPFSRSFGCGSSHYMSPECIGFDMSLQGYSTRQNDVWALGVILLSMICGHNPWRHATIEDPCYRAFVKDSDYLGKTLPISAAANNIFRRIFMPEPLRRVSLPLLRLMVLQIDTFFMTDDEISRSSDHVKNAAARFFAEPVPRPPTSPPLERWIHVPGWDFSDNTLCSEGSADSSASPPTPPPHYDEPVQCEAADPTPAILEVPRGQNNNEDEHPPESMHHSGVQFGHEPRERIRIRRSFPSKASLKERHMGLVGRIFDRFSPHRVEH
ncbi:hypothetical protein CERSUDRAFT_162364 [Gelatoporia subvermispora B]|uniref:Protein kinase domain-containing protein n=1 Tax=Ceriporiopsis subvermispora (strain B) TaxID=914234 RepID=M2QZE5_CERS8|nr:hypothetical protein CERSUDRAFT_162364 [Gelatoporia subvermispora B]